MKPKTLNNDSMDLKNEAHVETTGDPGLWVTICKASCEEEGWMKSTKAMQIRFAGCLVQVTTQQGDQVAEAVAFVPGCSIMRDDRNKTFYLTG